MPQEHMLDRALIKTTQVAEKTMLLGGAVAGSVEIAETLIDLSAGRNPINHVEGFGASVGITAVGLVALQGIRYYFTHRPEFLDPGAVDKSAENC